MNSVEKQLKVKSNLVRQSYLKVLSMTCLILDLVTYIFFESIELAFSNLEQNQEILFLYIAKLFTFSALALLIIIALLSNRVRLLAAGATLYLVIGLGMFCYLISQEMMRKKGTQPMEEVKPAIYYSLFLNIVIFLNILSAVFRILGTIFMFLYVKVCNTIAKLNEDLTDYLLPEGKQKYLSVNDSLGSSTRFKTLTNSMIEPMNRPFLNNRYSSAQSDEENKSTCKDVNIFINSTDTNNIYVHVHNYMAERKVSSMTYESEREREDHLESLYETPKRVSFAN